ncbi:MAG: hypothetical protein ACWGOV_09830 [Acidiferrobacterales bacterium]
MTVVHLFMAWLDSALLLSALVLLIGGRYKLQTKSEITGVVIVALVLLVPVHGLSLFQYQWSVIGDLSLTSKTYLIAWILYRVGGPVVTDMNEIRKVLGAIAILGLVFYPLSLGLSPFDPYGAGYSASVLIIFTVVTLAYGMRKGYFVLTAAMLLALWSYLLGLMESDNLFDYLLDPLLFLYAAGFTCVTLLRNLKAIKASGQKP